MTMPDPLFHDAVRRADVGLLSGHLDAQVCPPAVLGRLIRHGDPRMRYLGLVLLAERVTSGPPVARPETAELAALLPVSVTGPPETALVMAGLYERLGPLRKDRPRPSWRTAELPVRVRIAWLRAELLNDPTVRVAGNLRRSGRRPGAAAPPGALRACSASGQPALQETDGQVQDPLAWRVTPKLLPLPLDLAVSTWALG
ncbi:hypothetical protein [Streptomyces sp. NPDC001876]|uniref:hypothetical protein n=1 Tax=Streptomyces sp. NPDC001876 TaxID=3154402 RepID=UPI00332A71A2